MTQVSRNYKANRYDDGDALYASALRKLYVRLSEELKNSFDDFTGHLMSDHCINRYSLLYAIRDFGEHKFKGTMDGINFTDTAFNYRPY